MTVDPLVLIGLVLGPVMTIAVSIVGFQTRRLRAQTRLISRLRIHLVTTCMDKAEGLEKLAELLLSDGEEG